mgnify:FL=1
MIGTLFYFHLSFFQCLVTAENGYDFNNVVTWAGDANIFTKKFIYFPLVALQYYAHNILIVADMEDESIRYVVMTPWEYVEGV